MKRLVPIVLALSAVLSGCSTTRILKEGEYRLERNEIAVTNADPDFKPSAVSQYIKQQSASTLLFGWTPGLSIYNWSRGTGKGLDKLWEKLGTAPVVFNPALVESSKTNIANRLEYLGYYASKVDAEVTRSGRLATVKYLITLGERRRVDSLWFDLPADSPDFIGSFKADSASMLVQPGSWLSESLLEQESVRSASKMRNLGFYDFNKNNYFFVADTLRPDRTVLCYSVKGYTRNETPEDSAPISRYRFGDVTISHSASVPFREQVLRRMNLIQPGDTYSEDIVNTTYNRFSALKVFSGVALQMTPSDSATVDCRINLTESNLQGFKINGETSLSSSGLIGLSPQLSWYHKNIFHGGEWLNVGFTGNFQFRPSDNVHATELGVTSSLSLPRFVGLSTKHFRGSEIPRTEITAAWNYHNRPEYTRVLSTVNFGYTWQRSDFFYQIIPFRAKYIILMKTDPVFEQALERNPFMRDSYKSHLDAGVGGIVYHATCTDLVPKIPWHYERLSFDVSGNLLSLAGRWLPTDASGQRLIFGSPFTQYVRGELTLGRTWQVGNGEKTSMLASRIDLGAGYAYGNSSALPFEEQFYCGGSASMRGWQARSLGPGSSPMNTEFSIPSQSGDFKFEADLEYRFGIVSILEGALFAEAGNVWTLRDFSDENFFRTIAADWGVGLRVNLNFIVARLDLGLKLYDPCRASGARWLTPYAWWNDGGAALHFGVGYPF